MTKLKSTLLLALLICTNIYSQIIPIPQDIKPNDEEFTINQHTTFSSSEGKDFNFNYLIEHISPIFHFDVKTNRKKAQDNFIYLEKKEGFAKEAYKISVNGSGITLSASTDAGMFYACQSLLQLMPAGVYSGKKMDLKELKIQGVDINDFPRFSYRGMMFDVSRTFYDAEYIKTHLDRLAYHKINTFHWHLVDDTGWRIEIKKYPALTSKGAWRGDNEILSASYGSGADRNGGYYTQEEVKEIIKYAADRNIEVIPEIDMPGHSRAIAAVFPKILCDTEGESVSVNGEINNIWCASNENNFKIIENILREVASLFPSKYIHIGGDEVNYYYWQHCSSCQDLIKKNGMVDNGDIKKEVLLQNYFIRRVGNIINKLGKNLAGWDEIIEGGGISKDTQLYAWRSLKTASESVKEGYNTVMQIGAYNYLDMKQSAIERGHNWAAIIPIDRMYHFDPIGNFDFTPEQEKSILGIQCAIWTELMQYPPRFVEYQIFPRIAAFAEGAWSAKEDKNYDNFNQRLTNYHFDRLYNMGIAFRVQYPIVTYKNNNINVELPYSSAVVRYTMDGSDPTPNSPVINGQITTNHPEDFRFATFYNELQSITVGVMNIDINNYITPNTKIETNIEISDSWPIEQLTDYDFMSYSRSKTTVKPGDYLTYIFTEPVKCESIYIETGIPIISFYDITYGYVEYSYDGINYIKAGEFEKGIITIKDFEEKVKSVRIVVTKANDGHTACFQDIKIK